MTKEIILKLIVKYRNRIIGSSAIVFLLVTSLSYYYTGRFYRSSIDFYIINSTFDDLKTENNSNKIFPAADELEILRSISKSSELFRTVVKADTLKDYYDKKFVYEAIEELKLLSDIKIEERGKVSITVDDLNNYHGFKIASDLMNQIDVIFSEFNKKYKKFQKTKCENELKNFYSERKNIMGYLANYSSSTLEFISLNSDSLEFKNVLNKLEHKTKMKADKIINVINLIKRNQIVENQIYLLKDQNQRINNALLLINLQHLMITNKGIPFKRFTKLHTHILLGIQYTLVFMFISIASFIFIHQFKPELKILFAKKN